MPLRLLEVTAPGVSGERVREILQDRSLLSLTSDDVEGGTEARILLDVSDTEGVLDLLDQHFGKVEGFQVLVLSVEAAFPRPKSEEMEARGEREGRRVHRVSAEELYEDITQASELSPFYVIMVALSAIVAAIGILRQDLIILIGAMVIAPLFGPNAALALASTLGDASLARQAVRANLAGIGVAILVGAVVGLLIGVDVTNPLIEGRLRVDAWDILLAVVAGSAGAVAFTIVLPTALVGVMVSVALLPPTVILGMFVGSGQWASAAGTGLLLLVYLVGINLAGVLTFVAQGISPLTWWEEEQARRATRVSVAVWTLLLILLATLVALP